MTIRKATLEDIPQMQEIFAIARRFSVLRNHPLLEWRREIGLSIFETNQKH